MLRTLFVSGLIGLGVLCALRGPFGALLFYLWVAYFRPEEWVWTDFIRQLNLSYLIGLYLLAVSLTQPKKFRFDTRVILLVLFLVHSLVSLMLSVHTNYAWPYWLDQAKAIIITLMIAMLVDDRAKMRQVVLVIALSLGFEGAKQGWAELFRHPGAQIVNPTGPLSEGNAAGLAMLMLVPMFVSLAETTESRGAKLLYRFMLVGVLYRGIVSYSRGAFLASLALGCAYLLRARQKFLALLATAVIAAVIVPVLPDAFWNRMSTINRPENELDDSARGRLHFWRVAVRMAEDHPLTGVGYIAYNPSYDTYDFSKGAFGNGRAAHSIWFAVLSELGYPGFALYLAILFLAFRACARVRKFAARTAGFEDVGRYAVALEVALIAFCVGGSFASVQYIEMMWHLIGLSMALERLPLPDSAVEVEKPSHYGVQLLHQYSTHL